jgi:hypothetical protein
MQQNLLNSRDDFFASGEEIKRLHCGYARMC